MDMRYGRGTDGPPATAGHDDGIREHIAGLLAGFSVEITSHAAEAAPDFAPIPAGTRVYLPFLPNSTIADCVPAAERLAREGMTPVLHIAARRIASAAELGDVLARLRETAGLASVLVIAGDTDDTGGPYPGSMELLETGLLEQHGITDIGVAGYPDGHPAISDAAIRDSLARKCAYAETSTARFRIVSQFTFSHQSVSRWDDRLRQAGVALPVYVSVPGPARLTTLLGYARRCGVSASLRQLTRNTRALAGLATVRAPDRLITGIARHAAGAPESLIAGVHFNTFGGFEETGRWVGAVVDGRYVMDRDDEGFRVERT